MMTPVLNRRWMFSKAMARLYFRSALIAVGFFLLLFALEFRLVFGGGMVLELWLQFLLQLAFLVGALGLSTVWAGMWICMLNCEKETLAGSVYLPVFVLLGPLGTLIYYFVRFRKLVQHSNPPITSAQSA